MKKIDPRLKIYFVIINVILVILISSPVALGISVVLTALVIYRSKISFNELMKSVGFVIAVTFLICAVLIIWIEPVTALYVFLKCCNIIFTGVVFSKTTEQVDVLDGLEGAFHLRASTAKWVYLSIDFLPQLRHELDRVKISRVARGGRIEEQGVLKSLLWDVRVFGPAWKNTNVRSRRTAKAMDDRCYDVTTRRIRTSPLSYKGVDYVGLLITVLYTAAVVYLEIRIRFFGKLI